MSETKKHCVFTDLPPVGPIPKSVRDQRCFGRNCSINVIGPHRCPVGRCQRYEDAIIKAQTTDEG